MTDTLVFIDEAFLSKLSKYFGNGNYIKFDRKKLGQLLAEYEKLKCSKIFLYIAPPFIDEKPEKEEELRKQGYDKFVRNLKEIGILVREGRCQRLKIDGAFSYNQKAVDVYLAMDLTNVPLKFPEIKKIILISTDSDFVPVIKNLEENNVATILYTYYEKNRKGIFSRSNHLIKSVHKYKIITKEDLAKCLIKKEEIKT